MQLVLQRNGDKACLLHTCSRENCATNPETILLVHPNQMSNCRSLAFFYDKDNNKVQLLNAMPICYEQTQMYSGYLCTAFLILAQEWLWEYLPAGGYAP